MSKLYDSLYKLGYQSDNLMVHYAPVLRALRTLLGSDPSLNRVLDVGSSHGGGVRAMWSMGLRASGVDVAPAAVALAAAQHGADPINCVGPCWSAAPATALPFAGGAFDALVSTDVLEHLAEEDVERAVRELTRVTSKWMLLKISNRHESTRMEATRAPFAKDRGTYAALAKREYNVTLPRHLHTAVHEQAWWVAQFERAAFEFNATIRVPTWACCAFVLRRRR